jgi:tRNA-dihydrouridine synthase
MFFIPRGMIRELKDVDNCLEQTGADAVMSAIGMLYNESAQKFLVS